MDLQGFQGDKGETQRSRAGEGVITPPLESVWPDVERRLRALLYRRGLDHATAEDVVQEVAVRALAGRVTFTSAKDLLRWAGPVACNLHIDLLRQRARLHDGDVGHDHPATNDVAGEVADRLELQRAFRGIAALRPADREAIIEAVADEPTPTRNRKEAVRLAVRRHRARSRLALVLEQLAVWPFGWRLLRRSRTATAAVAIVPLAALPLVGAWQLPEDSRQPQTATVVTVRQPAEARDVRAQVTRGATEPAAAPTATRPARRAAPRAKPAPPKADVEIAAANGVATVVADGSDRRPDDPILICVWDLPHVPDRVCV